VDYLQGLESVSDQYDAYIFDIWGTIHDGQRRFPNVIETLRMLKSKNKKIGLLSNSPSRIAQVTAKLAETYSITPDLYDVAFNSGESSYIALRDRADDFHVRLGSRYYYIYAAGHEKNFADLPYQSVPFNDAEFIIITKTLDYNETIQDYETLLAEAAERRLPMICCNPDRIVGVGDTLFICPGTVAAYYETLGGNVYYHGKPYTPAYETIQRMMGLPAISRTLAIGDSFETDIRGGNRFGCDTLLLTAGIHQSEIYSDDPMKDVERLAAQFDASPKYVLDQVRW
jgi:HAD superfamily hydrolase (TIGR01459 family)